MLSRKRLFFACLAVSFALSVSLSACGTGASGGKITSKVSGVIDQDGMTYSVMAYNYNWQPGAPGPAVGGLTWVISEQDFSLTDNLRVLDAQGQPTEEQMVFPAGQYTVVFAVSDPGAAPQYFSIVHVSLNGPSVVTAPAWTTWTHQ